MNTYLLIFISYLLSNSGCLSAKRSELNQAIVATETTYRCVKHAEVNICFPGPGKGGEIYALIQKNKSSSEAASLIDQLMKELLPNNYQLTKQNQTHLAENNSSPIIIKLKNDFPDKSAYRINHYFPEIISKSFNTIYNISGPNCYNTVLIATELIPENKRYAVSLEEFNDYIREFFDQASLPAKPGDVIIYNAEKKRDHTSYYLFDDLVFHKQGFLKKYRYRITSMNEVYQLEPFSGYELDDFDPYLARPDIVNKNLQVFRPKKRLGSDWLKFDVPEEEQKLIAFLSDHVITNAGKKLVHAQLGLATEHLFEELLQIFSDYKKSNDFRKSHYWTHLLSLQHQVYQSLEDEVYSSPMANIAAIHKKYCLLENDYLRNLLPMLAIVFEKRLHIKGDPNNFFTRLKMQAEDDCKINFNKAFSEQEKKI